MSLNAKLEGGIPGVGGSCSLHLQHLANPQLLLMLKRGYFGFNVQYSKSYSMSFMFT